MTACFLSNVSAKYYKTPSMLSRVIAKNNNFAFFPTAEPTTTTPAPTTTTAPDTTTTTAPETTTTTVEPTSTTGYYTKYSYFIP